MFLKINIDYFRFISQLLFMLPGLHGEPRTMCLETLQSRVDNIENIFMELKNKKFNEILTHR